KPVKKGGYPLRPGVEGFFITCEGGRERQASNEAIDVIESFYEELVEASDSDPKLEAERKTLNKVTKFQYSSDDDDSDGDCEIGSDEQSKKKSNLQVQGAEVKNGDDIERPAKKQCVVSEYKSVDEKIDAELAELGDKSKRRFTKLDSGCNGVIFIRMSKKEGDPEPKDIVQHMFTSLASTRKHVSRFLLRVLPIEVTCYTSEEEIKRAMKPLIDKYFPPVVGEEAAEQKAPCKFAVLYDARANTGIERTKIIDAVAKSVPGVHKVDLANPDLHIVVQIVKTVCLIGVVERYKELGKYNIRQLTSP
ncbi:hypothetical protein M569_04248, partial [Genlisea aurea]